MLIHKITSGFVTQVFDTEKNQFVSQNFTAGDDCVYETPEGEPATELPNQYLPFDMVDPNNQD